MNCFILIMYCIITDMQLSASEKIILYSEEFKDTKGVIRIRKSKDRQHNDHKKGDKSTNNDLQNIHIKNQRSNNTNPTKTGVSSCAPEG